VVELRVDPREADYRLRVVWPDRREVCETFTSEQVMQKWLDTFHSQLLLLEWELRTAPAVTTGGTPTVDAKQPPERRAGRSDRRRITRQDRRKPS
jgi:hypothetical protein